MRLPSTSGRRNPKWDGTCGRPPRITAELRGEGERVNHKRVGRVMRKLGIAGLRLRSRVSTTVS
ncbi:hypothetical protein GCM10010421_10520 [Streptomyces glaucus]|uniref:HTH-like domain-containing protein n=1 Tax=Streptomyces glaucus TaxID=284029 RepID=A0ABP5WIF8_9ACTN